MYTVFCKPLRAHRCCHDVYALWLQNVQSYAAAYDVGRRYKICTCSVISTGSVGCLCADEEPPQVSVLRYLSCVEEWLRLICACSQSSM